MSSQHDQSYLIIGAGVFGASAAYHLSKSYSKPRITLLDRSPTFPCPLAASHDYNKIVRADYGNKFYCNLALEAREAWKTDSLYKPFYHESGMVVLDDTGLGRRIVKNYEELGAYSEATVIGREELKERYNGLFGDADLRNVQDVFVNPLSGWAEATSAVRAVINAAVSNGVKYVEGDVEKLLFNDSGDCIGVRTKDRRETYADKVVLSTGASTAKLLADSAPNRPGLQSADRITAAAVVTGVVILSEDQIERFKSAPIFIHAVGEVQGEVLAPTPEGLLKFCVDVSFKNTSLHKTSGQMISAPPDQPDQAQYTIPHSLKNECTRVVKGIYGKELADFQFDSFRICWDGITPNQDFIISSHPRCKDLYIATGGSFHGWKFLPIVGKYVVRMLDGDLDEELANRWAWDRVQEGSSHERIVPKRELGDLL